MASKLNNMNKAAILVAMLGLILGVLARSCVDQGLQENVEEEKGRYFGQQFDKVRSNVCRSIQDGFVTLTVKFLHFFISRCLQLRYLPALFPAPWTMSVILASIYSINLIDARQPFAVNFDSSLTFISLLYFQPNAPPFSYQRKRERERELIREHG